MNNIDASNALIAELKVELKLYFNLFALYFEDNCNTTVRTIGYVVPFHVEKLWNEYRVGFECGDVREKYLELIEIINAIIRGEIPDYLKDLIKPLQWEECEERFSDREIVFNICCLSIPLRKTM